MEQVLKEAHACIAKLEFALFDARYEHQATCDILKDEIRKLKEELVAERDAHDKTMDKLNEVKKTQAIGTPDAPWYRSLGRGSGHIPT